MWEVLLEDETGEKIKKNAWQVDEKITKEKEEMKKLQLIEKVTKIMEIKQLYQEVQAFQDQDQTRNDEVEAHELESVQATWILQPIQ